MSTTQTDPLLLLRLLLTMLSLRAVNTEFSFWRTARLAFWRERALHGCWRLRKGEIGGDGGGWSVCEVWGCDWCLGCCPCQWRWFWSVRRMANWGHAFLLVVGENKKKNKMAVEVSFVVCGRVTYLIKLSQGFWPNQAGQRAVESPIVWTWIPRKIVKIIPHFKGRTLPAYMLLCASNAHIFRVLPLPIRRHLHKSSPCAAYGSFYAVEVFGQSPRFTARTIRLCEN